MSDTSGPRPPAGSRAAGRRLFDSVTSRFELEQHELQLLVEAVRTTDLLVELDGAVRRDGALVETPQGMRAHPAAVEARQQRIVLARLLGALQLPADEDDEKRGRDHSGVRGMYTLRPGPRRAS